MQKSYIPQIAEDQFCDWMKLCSVRKNRDWDSLIWIKDLSWRVKEEVLATIINAETYEWKKIIRVYASWHIFIDINWKQVLLVTTEKNWKIQHQFTWWSPLEEENKKVIFADGWVYKFDLKKVRNNARIRTKNRTSVLVTEEYNEQNPIVDFVLMETEEDGEIYYKLICLIHFVVKKYEWILTCTWQEDSIDLTRYDIDKLQNTLNIAPNVYIVTKKALEII